MHTDRHHLTGSGWGMGWRRQGQVLGMLLGLLGCWQMGHAAEFTCPAGDEAAVACLIDAINAANANGEENTITLAAGSYTLQEVHNDTDGPNGLPSITSPLTLTGAGADATIIERQTSDPSGDTLAFCLLHVTATGRLTLTGVTLQGGGAELFESAGAGGGLRNSGGLVTLTNVTLAHNSTDHGGGGISNDGGTMTLTHVTLTGNQSVDPGGGIHNAGGTMTLTHVTLTDNDGLEGGGCIVNAARFGDGGIINRGTMTLTHVTLAHNSASDDAGGCIINGGTMTLTNVTLTDNRALDGGGGILNGGTMTLTNVTLTDNLAGGFSVPLDGGGILNSGTMTLTNVTLTDNRALDGGDGGGIDNRGTMTLTNVTLAHNTAFQGGGLRNSGGRVTLTNVTLAHNDALEGGGLYTDGIGSVTLQNTILARNTISFSSPQASDCFGVVTSLGTNLIGDPTGCTITLHASDLTGDPGLDDFTDDGTPGHGHFPLLTTSQAIDAGDDTTCPATDQLGHPRVGPCDIGAIEFQPSDTTLPMVTIVSVTPETLWPPNGKRVPVTLVATITDAGSGVDPRTPAYAVADEYGRVQPTGALTFDETGRYTATIFLRASRKGSDRDGRQYTITVSAHDLAGNEGIETAIVTVPHDRGRHRSLAAR